MIWGHSRHGGRRWPLHPQPSEWEGLESYVRRLAQAYGVSYDIFLRCALGHIGPGARDLHEVSDEFLTRLSTGTGVPIGRLRGMVGWSVMVRLSHRTRDWLETPEGRGAIKELRVTMVRKQRRMPASRDHDRCDLS